MSTDAPHTITTPNRADAVWHVGSRSDSSVERARASRYPIARWYVRPMAGRFARWLAPTRVRPNHLSVCGLIAALAAAMVIVRYPGMSPWAALLVLVYWFFDRADGQLARCQETASRWGAWLDGNIDELIDVVTKPAPNN